MTKIPKRIDSYSVTKPVSSIGYVRRLTPHDTGIVTVTAKS